MVNTFRPQLFRPIAHRTKFPFRRCIKERHGNRSSRTPNVPFSYSLQALCSFMNISYICGTVIIHFLLIFSNIRIPYIKPSSPYNYAIADLFSLYQKMLYNMGMPAIYDINSYEVRCTCTPIANIEIQGHSNLHSRRMDIIWHFTNHIIDMVPSTSLYLIDLV